VYKKLFGCEPTGMHTSRGDVDALARIVFHDKFKDAILLKAKQLRDFTGRQAVLT
jgi:hypothetical protein